MIQSTNNDLLDGAVYIAKKHRSDLETLAIWVGLVIVASALGWGFTHLINLGATHPIQVCQTVAQCNRYILSHPIHFKVPPGYPTMPTYAP